MSRMESGGKGYESLHGEIVELLESARRSAVRNINALMTAAYWAVGRRIAEVEQKGRERALYGEELIKRLGADLGSRFGRGFGSRNLAQMRAFYLAWPVEKILQTLSAKSSGLLSLDWPVTGLPGAQVLQASVLDGVDLGRLAHAFPLPWSAYVCLLSVKNLQARDFYEVEALRCGWSVRQLSR